MWVLFYCVSTLNFFLCIQLVYVMMGAVVIRLGIISSLSPNLEESPATCDPPREGKPGDRENDSDCEPSDTYFDSEDKNHKLKTLPSIKSTENKDIGVSKRPSKAKSQKHSPKICSPMEGTRQ